MFDPERQPSLDLGLPKPIGAPEPAVFDYDDLDAKTAKLARRARDRIKGLHCAAIIESGRELLQVKDALGHGRFERWLDAELNFAPTTARNYMRAAKAFKEGVSAIVAGLPAGALYAAAAAPEEVRDLIYERLERGEKVDRQSVVSMTRAFKDKQAQKERGGADEAAVLREEMREADEDKLADDVVDRLTLFFAADEIEAIASLWRRAGQPAIERAVAGLKTRPFYRSSEVS